MAIEEEDGAFILRGLYRNDFRAHFTHESFVVTMGSQVFEAAISEAKLLGDWIGRKLDEAQAGKGKE